MRYPVVEVFGPTIQGEGPAQGARCWFLRLGGCDYRCSWCDSLYAVEPAQVREAPRMEPEEAVAALGRVGFPPDGMLVVSGGNPALHKLGPLLDLLPTARVHVETQGTVFREWLNRCRLVVVSPKPPSAGMGDGLDAARAFVRRLSGPWALKLVAFDDADLDWAAGAYTAVTEAGNGGFVGGYLSAGTDQHAPDLAAAAVERYAWLANRCLEREDLAPFCVGLQQHVLAWPGERAR